MYTVVVKDSR